MGYVSLSIYLYYTCAIYVHIFVVVSHVFFLFSFYHSIYLHRLYSLIYWYILLYYLQFFISICQLFFLFMYVYLLIESIRFIFDWLMQLLFRTWIHHPNETQQLRIRCSTRPVHLGTAIAIGWRVFSFSGDVVVVCVGKCCVDISSTECESELLVTAAYRRFQTFRSNACCHHNRWVIVLYCIVLYCIVLYCIVFVCLFICLCLSYKYQYIYI